ncbi:MAG: DUF559 domain-containing protein [Candidatus Izemoplasmatales bacterium]|jgi:G:T-mismatch repair DNA endonuclease (very short patch repair protein)
MSKGEIRNHKSNCPCGVCKAIRGETKGRNHPEYIERESRVCKCGCNETFICRINSKQKFLFGHINNGRHSSQETKNKRFLTRKFNGGWNKKNNKSKNGWQKLRNELFSMKIDVQFLTDFECFEQYGKKLGYILSRCACPCQHFFIWKAQGRYKKQLRKFINGHNETGKNKPLSKGTIEKIRKARFEQIIPTSNTLPERIVQGILVKNKLDFVSQYNVDYLMIVDFYIPQYKIMIFVDGDYWHCHSRFNYKDDQIIHHGLTKREINDKDSTQENYLKWKGYQVLRFWEYDIKNKIHEVESKLMEVIRNDIKRKNEVV